jgi:hypothetical protein
MSALTAPGGGNSGSSSDILVRVYVVGRSQKFGAIKLTPGDVAYVEYQIHEKLPIELAGIGPTGFEIRTVPDTMLVYDDARRYECVLLTDPVVLTPNTRIVIVPLNTVAAPVLQGQTNNTQQQAHDSSAPSAVAPANAAAAVVGGTGMPVDTAGEVAGAPLAGTVRPRQRATVTAFVKKLVIPDVSRWGNSPSALWRAASCLMTMVLLQ